jgi:WD40-like Beta Propeller Repeat
VFRIRRRHEAWGEPERIREVSSAGNEWFPNQAANGTLYFGSERRAGNRGPAGTADLWRARWLGDHYAEPESLGAAINSAGQEIEPWIAPDESLLVFAAKGRADSLGSYDLYASRACDGEWSAPQPLGGGVNSQAWDFGGRFSPDGATFYFGSNRSIEPAPLRLQGTAGYRALVARLRAPGNGLFDLYAVAATALALPAPCPAG